MEKLRVDAKRIAERFKLEYRGLAAEHPRVKSRYGVCYKDGFIKIRLRHSKTGKPLKYSSLIDTLCHELAHLKHFNHGPEFKQFFLTMLSWARKEKIYQPGPTSLSREQDNNRESSEQVAQTFAHMPLRNGVPIFPTEKESPASEKTLLLPWERSLPVVSTEPKPTPAQEGSNQKIIATVSVKKPEQLSLF